MKLIKICTPFVLSLACIQLSADVTPIQKHAERQNEPQQSPAKDSNKMIGDNDRTDEDYFSNYRYGDEKNIPVPNMYMDKDGNPEAPSYRNYPDYDY